jgi:hypothetical protein
MAKVSSQKKMAGRHFSDCQEEPSESDDFSSSMRESINEISKKDTTPKSFVASKQVNDSGNKMKRNTELFTSYSISSLVKETSNSVSAATNTVNTNLNLKEKHTPERLKDGKMQPITELPSGMSSPYLKHLEGLKKTSEKLGSDPQT